MKKLTSLGAILTKQQKKRIVVEDYGFYGKLTGELDKQQAAEKLPLREEPAFAMMEA